MSERSERMKVASDALLAMPIEMDVPTPLEDAVEQMTDSWIDDGQYSAQTVFDLRDALREAIIILKANKENIGNERAGMISKEAEKVFIKDIRKGDA